MEMSRFQIGNMTLKKRKVTYAGENDLEIIDIMMVFGTIKMNKVIQRKH